MVSDDDIPVDEDAMELGDGWDEFREEDAEPVGIEIVKKMNLANLPEDVRVWILDDYYPEATVWREDDVLVCEILEHLHQVLGT